MNIELITAVAIGIGLSASAGFRVFIPMLVAAVGTSLLSLVIPFFIVAGFLLLILFTLTTLRKRRLRTKNLRQ